MLLQMGSCIDCLAPISSFTGCCHIAVCATLEKQDCVKLSGKAATVSKVTDALQLRAMHVCLDCIAIADE